MARELDGAASYLQVPAAAISQDVGAVALWLRPDFAVDEAASRYIASADMGSSSFYLLKLSGTNLRVYNNGRYATFPTAGLWVPGQWTHMLFAYDKAADEIYLWVNGVAQTYSSITGTWGTETISTALALGAYYAGTSSYLDGAYCEVLTLNRVPTTEEVLNLANGRDPIELFSSSLSSYFPLKSNLLSLVSSHAIVEQDGPTTVAGPGFAEMSWHGDWMSSKTRLTHVGSEIMLPAKKDQHLEVFAFHVSNAAGASGTKVSILAGSVTKLTGYVDAGKDLRLNGRAPLFSTDLNEPVKVVCGTTASDCEVHVAGYQNA